MGTQFLVLFLTLENRCRSTEGVHCNRHLSFVTPQNILKTHLVFYFALFSSVGIPKTTFLQIFLKIVRAKTKLVQAVTWILLCGKMGSAQGIRF